MDFEAWQNSNGRSYFKDFLRDEGGGRALKLTDMVTQMERYSLQALLSSGDVKLLRQGLYEIRIHIEKIWYRFLFVIRLDRGWILLAFRKQSNKTPPRHIDTALNRAAELDIQILNKEIT